MCSTKPDPDSPAFLAERDAGLISRVLIAPIRFYQRFMSPVLPPACRFHPSCSQYTREAIALWGIRGLWLGFKRILRCQPMFPGGYDPVPVPAGMAAESGGAPQESSAE